ncbi:MAG: CTP synthase [Candidatus Omnitrophota bacterium]|jgi:CTP synthase
MAKYIFVTGGVVSSLGKGVASAALGKMLESRGLKVTILKCDPYLNVDPGTMSPYQHGEVYVTQDGAETDLDLGHYERFLSTPITRANNITAGRVYNSVIAKERKGEYLGATVQVIPHITDEIQRSLRAVDNEQAFDVVICEIGGTVGDIESLPFLEAIRQFRLEIGQGNAIDIHLTLIPYIKTASELKTKPTQHSVGKLREIGIQPEILLCRTEKHLSDELKQKISLFCNVHPEQVIECLDVDDIYKVPLELEKEGLDKIVVRLLKLKCKKADLSDWRKKVIAKILKPTHRVRIGVVGKYTELQDAYKSIYEALKHGGIANDASVDIVKMDATCMDDVNPLDAFAGLDGILIPGGFGDRGLEGKLKAAKYARENLIPFFGICLGMQCAVIEIGRNLAGFANANTTEVNKKTPYPLISLLEEQKNVVNKGGTMRLGSYPAHIKAGTLARKAYKKDVVNERHRHRYEFNNKYKVKLQQSGLIISATSPNGRLVEMVELADHPWYVACQYHPEFQSKPDKPHPLFADFIKASINFQKETRS